MSGKSDECFFPSPHEKKSVKIVLQLFIIMIINMRVSQQSRAYNQKLLEQRHPGYNSNGRPNDWNLAHPRQR